MDSRVPAIRFFDGPTGHRVAYAVHGAGRPLVCAAWWVSHAQKDWDQASFRQFFGGLADGRSVVRYDRPGSGMSERERARADLEGEVATLEALVDALGVAQVDLLGISCGGPPAITYASRHPERVGRLVLVGSFLHGADVGDAELRDALMALVRAHWGLGAKTIARLFAPDLPREAVETLGKLQRATASGEMAARLVALTFDADARNDAAGVRAPTLVLHRRDDQTVPLAAGVALSAAIPDAVLQVLDGSAHVPWLGDVEEMLHHVRSFLTPGADASAAPVTDAAPGTSAAALARLARSGDLWTVTFDGETAHLKHARGVEDLARLVSCPDQQVQALALYQGEVGSPKLGADPVVDEQALAAYRARLADLEEDVTLARERGDVEGAEALLVERAALAREIAGAVGLGERRRRLGDEAERARKAVTSRVRATLQKIAEVHPALHAHLQARITTGSHCCYRGDPDLAWQVD